jgi:hypothetical protein
MADMRGFVRNAAGDYKVFDVQSSMHNGATPDGNILAGLDRPTMLEGGERGLENWIRPFRQTFLEKMGEENAQRWIREVERQYSVELFKNGSWELDYRRLRIAAWKA